MVGPAAKWSCPPSHSPANRGEGRVRATASDSRRAAWWPHWEVPSVPRPRRWIHSPTLVSEAEVPPTPTLCLPFREQTEAGTLWSLLSTVGSSPCPEPAVSHARAPGGPEVLPPAGPLVSRALERQGREISVSKPSVRSQSWIEGSVQQPALRILCSLPSLFFPCCVLGVHILALPCHRS